MTITKANWMRQVGGRAIDLFFPPGCVVCGQAMVDLPDGIAMCSACRQRLARLAWATCGRCAARVPEIPGNVATCHHCRLHKIRFDRTLALGAYEGVLRDIVLKMKDDATGQLATALGKLLSREFGDAIRQLRPDALAPIPMHARRRLSRRANAPASLATTVGRELGLPVTRNLLRWQRDASTQLGLSGRGRFRNMHGVMQLRRGYHLDAPHLMLVDDILTTGATCSEAARVLKRGGASQVSVLVVGRTSSA